MLGALSLLLNGGGVGQLQTITRELDRTLHGREGEARSVLHRIRSFAGQLDRHKHDIVQALQALDRLSRSLNTQRSTIDATLDELPGALRSINTPAARPGPDAQGARAPERGRRPRDQAVEGRRRSTPCAS